MKKFLTAKWLDLVMANYAINRNLLADLVPKGTELDFFEGETYVSLVAFKFVDTAVLGFKIPFHTNFEEVNLRFYVKRGDKRGVVFIKEIVPRMAISFVAKTFYGEPYETWRMSHEDGENELTFTWGKGRRTNRVYIEYQDDLGVPDENSHASFIIEHYWGYTRRSQTRTDEYKVEHPKWSILDINYAEIDVDFGTTYGKRFSFLTEQEPKSIIMAKGSEISVYKGEMLR
jgi:hypothetical protein